VQWQTVATMQAARDYDPSLPPVLYQEGNLSVALTRNRIVEQFLASDCDVLAMVDDDIAPPLNFVELLLPFVGEYAMVGMPHVSPHPTEPHNLILCVYAADPEGLRPMGLFDGINECAALATGCVLISRRALVELGPAPFRIEHDPRAALQSDDMLFCADLRTAGFRIGCYWNGHPVDHFRATNLTPLYEGRTEGATRIWHPGQH
jgi:hypothetical protein